jgi:hypothetical protein
MPSAPIICRTDASRAAVIEDCRQEALAITEEHKLVVLALAQALIDHPQRTLNAAESAQTLARQALAALASHGGRYRLINATSPEGVATRNSADQRLTSANPQ